MTVMKIRKFTDGTELHWMPNVFSPRQNYLLDVGTKRVVLQVIQKADSVQRDNYFYKCSENTTPVPVQENEGEKSGLSVDYYKVHVANPTTPGTDPYTAECNDLIESLHMTYAESNVFKAIWRSAAARTLGKKKAGNDALYDAEKMVFFSGRVHSQVKFQQNETK